MKQNSLYLSLNMRSPLHTVDASYYYRTNERVFG